MVSVTRQQVSWKFSLQTLIVGPELLSKRWVPTRKRCLMNWKHCYGAFLKKKPKPAPARRNHNILSPAIIQDLRRKRDHADTRELIPAVSDTIPNFFSISLSSGRICRCIGVGATSRELV